MKIGVATWGIEGGALPAKVARFGELGFGAVSFFPPQLPEIGERLDEIADVLKEHDLHATFHLGFGASDRQEEAPPLEEQFALVLRSQERTQRVRCVTFDAAYFMDVQPDGNAFDQAATVAGLKLALERLAPHAIQIGIETWLINMKLPQLAETQTLVGDERLGLLLDIGHLNIGLHTNALDVASGEEYISRLPLKIIELHVHDNDGAKDNHWPLGRGNLDLDCVMSAILQTGSDGVATVEASPDVEDRSFNNPEAFARIDDTRRLLAAAIDRPHSG